MGRSRRSTIHVPLPRYTLSVPPPAKPRRAKPRRIQVTLDPELAAAVRELGGSKPRSRAVHDLALRGAEAIRAEQTARREAIDHLLRIANGEDDRYDFSISEQLHADR
jgi:hypothetical protein